MIYRFKQYEFPTEQEMYEFMRDYKDPPKETIIIKDTESKVYYVYANTVQNSRVYKARKGYTYKFSEALLMNHSSAANSARAMNKKGTLDWKIGFINNH